jgi:hypothetical protein
LTDDDDNDDSPSDDTPFLLLLTMWTGVSVTSFGWTFSSNIMEEDDDAPLDLDSRSLEDGIGDSITFVDSYSLTDSVVALLLDLTSGEEWDR